MGIDDADARRQLWYKRFYCALMLVSASGYGGLLLWGLLTTDRQGTPSISRMLADNTQMTLFFVVMVAFFGEGRALANLARETDVKYMGWRLAALTFGLMSVIMFEFVAFITLDDDHDAHNAVAGLGSEFTLVRECILFGLRFRWYDRKSWSGGVFMFTNGFTLFGFMLTMLVYGANELVAKFGDQNYISTAEYVMFGCVVFLPLWQLADFDVVPKSRTSQEIISAEAKRQRFFKMFYTFLMFLSSTGFGAMLLWGLLTTNRQGIPTISRMLADDMHLTLFYVICVVLYGEGRAIAGLARERDARYARLREVAMIVGIFGVVMFEFVAFITLDDGAFVHYAITSLAAILSFIRESILFWIRNQRKRKTWRGSLFIITNFLVLLLLLVMMILYGISELDAPIGDMPAVFEFVLFGTITVLPLWQLADFGEPETGKPHIP